MTENLELQAGLEKVCLQKRFYSRIFLAGVSGILIAVWLSRLYHAGRYLPWIVFLYVILHLYFFLSLAMIKCPQCTKHFFFRRFLYFIEIVNPFASRCMHCKISLKK